MKVQALEERHLLTEDPVNLFLIVSDVVQSPELFLQSFYFTAQLHTSCMLDHMS